MFAPHRPTGRASSAANDRGIPNGITRALAMSFPFQRPVLQTNLVPSVAANGSADSSTSMNETRRESEIAFLGPYGRGASARPAYATPTAFLGVVESRGGRGDSPRPAATPPTAFLGGVEGRGGGGDSPRPPV